MLSPCYLCMAAITDVRSDDISINKTEHHLQFFIQIWSLDTMAYFTDKAFSSSFLSRSKGLSDMIVKKEDEDHQRQSSLSSSSQSRGYDDGLSFREPSSRQRSIPKMRDYLSTTIQSEYDLKSKSYFSTSSTLYPRPSASSSHSITSSLRDSSSTLSSSRTSSLTTSRMSPSLRSYPRSDYDTGYSTVLVRARSMKPSSDEDDNSSPVDLLIARGSRNTSERKKLEVKAPLERKEKKEEYYSDKYFSNYFLNTNPKLEQMILKTEK